LNPHGSKPLSFGRPGGGESDRLLEENRLLRDIFATATAEFETLRGQVRSLEQDLAREREKSTSLAADRARLAKALEKSEARGNKFASMLFAVKSEKLKLADIDLGSDAVAIDSATATVIREGVGPGPPPADGQAPQLPPGEEKRRRSGARPGHRGSGRRIPDSLPVEEVRLEIPAEDLICPECGEPGVEKAGLEAVSYQVTVRKQYLLRKITRIAYGPTCACGRLPTISTAPPPAQLIPKGKFATEMWVDILIAKFMSHLPVNRQLFDMVQAGIDVSSGMVFGALRRIHADFLKPLHDAMILELRLAGHWHADETRWRMFLPECKSLWYMWGYRSETIVAFVLDQTRAAAVPLKTLFNLDVKQLEDNGLELDTDPVEIAPEQMKTMNVDRYSAYKTLMRYGLVLLAYCWAHVRRDFIDIGKKYPANAILCEWAEAWVLKIANLYRINNERVNHPKDGQLFLEYDTRLREAIQDMRKDLDEECPHGAQAKAMASMLAHWEGLTLFVDHPELPMDNNRMENDMRGCALGRNNFLGTHSRWGGELAACMYSLVKTCLLNEIDPKAYLAHYFKVCTERTGPMDAEAARKILPHRLGGRVKEQLKLRRK
jgi:transposase